MDKPPVASTFHGANRLGGIPTVENGTVVLVGRHSGNPEPCRIPVKLEDVRRLVASTNINSAGVKSLGKVNGSSVLERPVIVLPQPEDSGSLLALWRVWAPRGKHISIEPFGAQSVGYALWSGKDKAGEDKHFAEILAVVRPGQCLNAFVDGLQMWRLFLEGGQPVIKGFDMLSIGRRILSCSSGLGTSV